MLSRRVLLLQLGITFLLIIIVIWSVSDKIVDFRNVFILYYIGCEKYVNLKPSNLKC